MPNLSKHYAVVTLPDGTELKPISVNITADEAWSPYIQGTIVLPADQVTGEIDPLNGDHIGIRMQQDFGDIIYLYELTKAFGGDVSAVTAAYAPVKPAKITREFSYPWNTFSQALPISKVTTTYAPVTPLKLTNAGFSTVYQMTDFLHTDDTFNPAPSTIFDGELSVREIEFDYITKEATLQVSSDEHFYIDRHGYGLGIYSFWSDLRSMLENADILDESIVLQPGTANISFDPQYFLPSFEENIYQQDNDAWTFMDSMAKTGGLVIYADEKRRWWLVEAGSVIGSIQLKDDENITSFKRIVSRERGWYNAAVVRWEFQDAQRTDINYPFGLYGAKTLFIKYDNVNFPDDTSGTAAAIVARTLTRGETYEVEAIANFNARPRQEITIDITGESLKTGVIQSVTWSLPSARMNIELRDLKEV